MEIMEKITNVSNESKKKDSGSNGNYPLEFGGGLSKEGGELETLWRKVSQRLREES